MRPGRLDRKIEIPLPNEQARMEILKIHASKLARHGDIDYEAVVKLAELFNGADLRNICTEAGMFAIRDERDYVVQEDFMKAVRKLAEAKKLENQGLSYSAEWGDGGKGIPADLNGDGVVDASDLAALLGNWGGCPG
jgi:26S proteasome regulatory subunit T4